MSMCYFDPHPPPPPQREYFLFLSVELSEIKVRLVVTLEDNLFTFSSK